MSATPAGRPDVDRILDAIRAEARAGASAAAGMTSQAPGALPLPERAHAADYIALPLQAFLQAAYRDALGRDPDGAGREHYVRQMLRGRLTRLEVLARLRFSPEGRRRAHPIPGLALAAAFASAYRVPVAGPLAALIARALAFPVYLQDRRILEAAAFATGAWLRP